MNRNNYTEACVEPHGRAARGSDLLDDDAFIVSGVLVQGAAALNRATDGDIVALRVLPRAKWRAEVRVNVFIFDAFWELLSLFAVKLEIFLRFFFKKN